MRLIDSHCHLNYAGLAERQDEVLANARARGVTGFLNISTRQSEWGDVLRALKNPQRKLCEGCGARDVTGLRAKQHGRDSVQMYGAEFGNTRSA